MSTTREQLFPVGGSDYDCDVNAPPIQFRLEPDSRRAVDLSTVELVSILDTNATIALAGNLAAGAGAIAAQMLAAQWSFTYPQGISAFIGRVRISTASGQTLEEISNVNVLAETRHIFLSPAECDKLNRMEQRGTETNSDAFIVMGNVANVTRGTGNTASGNNVLVTQQIETRFRFGSLGGFMSQTLFPLSAGLQIDIFMAPFDAYSRRLSILPFQSPCLQSTGLTTTYQNGANTFTFSPQTFPANRDLAGTTGIIPIAAGSNGGIRITSTGTTAGGYLEQGLIPMVLTAANGNLTTSTYRNTQSASAAAGLPTAYTDASTLEMVPVDGVSKLAAPVAINTNFSDTAVNNPAPATTDMRAHGIELTAFTVTGGNVLATMTTAGGSFDNVNYQAGFSSLGYDWAQGAYSRLPLYCGRMCKVQVCTTAQGGAGAVYRFDIFRASVIAQNIGTSAVTITPAGASAVFANQVAPVAGLPIGMLTMLAEPDLTVTGTPRLSRVHLEYESVMGISKDLKLDITADCIRTETYSIPNGATDPSVALMSTVSHADGVLCAIPSRIAGSRGGIQSLINDGLTSLYPTYDNIGITSLPIRLKGTDSVSPVPSEVVWLTEQAMSKRIKQPSLLTSGGGSYDGLTSVTIAGNGTARVSSSHFCFGVPLDGKELIKGRLRLDFRGTINSANGVNLNMFIKYTQKMKLEKDRLEIAF